MCALMTVLAMNGLQVSEPLLCDVEHLGRESGHETLSVTRKGKAERVRVPLAPVTSAAVQEWLDARAQTSASSARAAARCPGASSAVSAP